MLYFIAFVCFLQVPSALATPCIQQLLQSVEAARERLSLLESQVHELRCAQEGGPSGGAGGPCLAATQQPTSCGGPSSGRADGVMIAEIIAAQRDLLFNASKRVRSKP